MATAVEDARWCVVTVVVVVVVVVVFMSVRLVIHKNFDLLTKKFDRTPKKWSYFRLRLVFCPYFQFFLADDVGLIKMMETSAKKKLKVRTKKFLGQSTTLTTPIAPRVTSPAF